MILGLCVICMACLGWAVASIATRPPSAEASRREGDRRFRRLYRNPELVNVLDIENLLRTDGVAADTVTRTMRRAERYRISARTMWRWADQHGTARLVVVLDAGLSEDTLLDHLDAGTAPEWRSISVFADLANDTVLAGMPLDELVDLDAVPAFEDLTFVPGLDDWTTNLDEELAGFDSLPPIADPGFGPFSAAEALEDQAAASAPEPEPVDPQQRDEGSGGDWPAVA